MVATITRQLTQQDILDDESWINGSVVLVTSNVDRAVINTCMATELARRSQLLLYRWRKPILGEVSNSIQELLYNEAEHPELFGYFYFGAPAHILDNANGNFTLGVANGTRCWYHSLVWDDGDAVSNAVSLTEEALHSGKSQVDLPLAPEFIHVRLADRDGNLLVGSQWPIHANLEDEWIFDPDGQPMHKKNVVIPIGAVQSNGDNYTIKLNDSRKEEQPIRYEQHAVDLALALTIWKAQGSTFNRVITLLEGSANAPKWEFEHWYVAMSRVKNANSLRSLHTTLFPDRDKYLALRPDVFTVKWLMDLDEKGRWSPRNARKPERSE